MPQKPKISTNKYQPCGPLGFNDALTCHYDPSSTLTRNIAQIANFQSLNTIYENLRPLFHYGDPPPPQLLAKILKNCCLEGQPFHSDFVFRNSILKLS